MDSVVLWLGLITVGYMALALFWARQSAMANHNVETWFSAGHSLPPWMSALVGAGASVSIWFLLGTADAVATQGFSAVAALQAGVLLAIPGMLFYKRAWFVAQRFRVSSQIELLRLYYRSEFLAISSAVIALLFAVAFAGMQLRVLAGLLSSMTAGELSPLFCAALLTLILFGYVVIGGMRAVAYLGMLQTVALVSATLTLGGVILTGAGDPSALMSGLAEAAGSQGAQWFSVAGVVQFVPGFGRGEFLAHPGSAAMILSAGMAVLGVACSPVLFKLLLSSRSATGVAAGQTWVLAGFFGALILFMGGLLGAIGLLQGQGVTTVLKGLLAGVSPWFSAWVVFGLVAGMQLFAGLALLVAAESLIRHLYKPWFHSSLSRRATVNLTRIGVVVLAVVSLLMAFLTPVALSALGALALPLSAQFMGPLVGMLWFRWITPPAAVVGFGFGIAAVFLTDAAGIYILSYLGLELPWGRYPWTIHAAGWGLFCNVLAILLVSAVSRHRQRGALAEEVRAFIAHYFAARTPRWLNSLAWSIVLAWAFLAVGPGTIFGNFAFVDSNGAWVLGVPSLWAWSVLFWLLGTVLVWFLGYRMAMASPERPEIEPRATLPPLRHDPADAERERLRRLIITAVAATGVILLIIWSFGG